MPVEALTPLLRVPTIDERKPAPAYAAQTSTAQKGARVNRRLRHLALATAAFAAAIVASLSSSPVVESTPPEPDGLRAALSVDAQSALARPVRDTHLRKTPRLSSHLDFLYRIDLLGRAAGRPVTAQAVGALPSNLQALVRAKLLRLDASGRVQVFVHVSGDLETVTERLRSLGFEAQRDDPGSGILQGWLPVAQLEAASRLDGVRFVGLPDYPFVASGAVTTEGDAILNADDLRAAFGVDGSGVRVGVISDGVEGLAAAQASGDLPAVNTTTCNVVPQSPTSPGAGAEGTAMLEIVHDLAPGAELWFGHFGMGFGGTSLDFMAAVDCLADNVDVIIDDIAFFNTGPYDGTSPVSQNAAAELNNPANRVRGYYNAVGNKADRHYQEAYVDDDPADPDNDLHRFGPTATTSDALGLGALPFDPVYLLSGQAIIVFLQWDDPFGTSSNDYDLYLVRDSDGALVAASEDEQSGTQDPVEVIAYTNPGPDGWFFIAIDRFAGSPRTFDMFMFIFGGCVALPGGACHNFNTPSSSVPNNSDAGGGVVSLGAINASHPGADTIASYSSRGPTNDGRLKPDATAIDGVLVTGSGGFSVPFYGTSAAAPHAGGAAALLLSCNPALRAGEPGDDPASDRTALRNALLGSAVDLGPAGPDMTYGHGRLDALAAAQLAGCITNRQLLCMAMDDCDHDIAFPRVYGDGCSAIDEQAKSFNGFGFDSSNPWDFYTVPAPALKAASSPGTVFRDNQILAGDAQAVFGYAADPLANAVGKPLYEADLNGNGVRDGLEYDRSVVNPGPPGAPDGVITSADAQKAFAMARDPSVNKCPSNSGYRMDDPW